MDLVRDVKLGVLEKLPTTWLSRMVITAKSNAEPRRTVDYQPPGVNIFQVSSLTEIILICSTKIKHNDNGIIYNFPSSHFPIIYFHHSSSHFTSFQ